MCRVEETVLRFSVKIFSGRPIICFVLKVSKEWLSLTEWPSTIICFVLRVSIDELAFAEWPCTSICFVLRKFQKSGLL